MAGEGRGMLGAALDESDTAMAIMHGFDSAEKAELDRLKRKHEQELEDARLAAELARQWQ